MLETYFRNGIKMDGQWVYSTRNAFEDFQETFVEVIDILIDLTEKYIVLCTLQGNWKCRT
jgi:tmRNA-binding protein